MLNISLGMSPDEVEKVMGSGNHTIYQSKYPFPLIENKNPEADELYCIFYKSFTTITNPYRIKEITFGYDSFTIYYYVTGHLSAGCEVTDADLTPVVFQHVCINRPSALLPCDPGAALLRKKVVGWGWEFLEKLKEDHYGLSEM